MNKTFIIAVLVCLPLFGIGCDPAQVENGADAVNIEIDARIFEGNWSYVAASVWDESVADTDLKKKVHVSLSIDVAGTEVVGEYTAELRDQDTDEAVYTSQGSFTGLPIASESGVVYVDGVWAGDRSDKGMAELYIMKDGSLWWSGDIESDDGIFTIPEDMTMTRRPK